jgi:predicted Zn-dependent peptidase
MYKKFRLDNGLKVVTHTMPRMQSVALGIWIKVGGRYESTDTKGTAHYLEHLLFKGSKKYSCRKLKESIEGVGGALNGFTSEELTCYLAKLPSRYLNLSLDILSDMVMHPSLVPQEVEKEKTVILEEIKMYKDQPQSYVYELLDELLWPNQPLGQTISGTVESVNKIKREDLRQFKQQYYTAANIIVSAAGALEYKNFHKKVQSIFSGLKSEKSITFVAAKENQHKAKLKIFHKETEQTHLALGFHGFKRDHPLKHALGLLHVVLGANMSSRLFNEVREKRGLAYEIGTAVKRFQDTGAFIVHAGIDNQKVTEAIDVILQELEKVKSTFVTNGEFRRAKDFYLGQLMLALEDTLDHMLWLGETTASLNKTYSLEEIIKEVNAVRRDDLHQVAKTLFKEEKINLALIGPLKESEPAIYNRLNIK